MTQTSEPGTPGQKERPARLERLKNLLRFDPANEQLARECVSLALEAGDYDFVLARSAEVLHQSPGNTQAQFDRASALIGKRDYPAAIEALQALVAQSPDITAAQVNLGLCYYAIGEYAQARAPLDLAFAAGERSPGTLRLLVSTYHHLGLIEEAVAIADSNPPPSQCGAALPGVYALLYIDAEQPLPAARYAAQALAANPDSVDGLVARATLDAVRLRVEPARERYSRALELAPATGRAWIGLGSLALLSRDFATARKQIERGLETLPNHTGSWLLLAWVHIVAGDIEQAEQTLHHTLELDRNFAEARGALAAVLALRGDRAGAEREIEVARRLDPDGLSVHVARSVLMARGGDSVAARKIIDDALAALTSGDGAISSALKRATRH
ncbi:MAG: tetratricopeptide repeat protein [Gammaproteobacteria bacterium]